MLLAVPTFATNMSGKVARLEKPGGDRRRRPLGPGAGYASRLLVPPVTVTGAQFMYISRLPILLNQVHARVYWPFAMPSGMEKSNVLAPEPFGLSGRFPSAFDGQPPMME